MLRKYFAQVVWLFSDRRANVAIMTALCALPLFGMMGLAIDFAMTIESKSRLDAAADAAALVAIKTAAQVIQSGGSTSTAISQGQQSATKAFAGNAGQSAPGATPSLTVNIQLSNNTLTSSASYATPIKLSFGGFFGVGGSRLSGSTSASMSLPSYINIYLMVDTSGSTSIGASSTDQQALITQTGCAFACHDGNPVNGYSDAYTYAEAKGIQLRYDVLNQGIQSFLNTVDATDPSHQYLKASIYTFDSSLIKRAALTNNTNTLRQNLPSAPATSGEYDGATHFNESISSVMSDIGTGGDGLSSGSPKKLLIIATDGVEDPNRTWTYDISLRPQVQVIDTSFCSTLTSSNVTVSFIHMPYLPMPWDWGYVATLGQPAANNPSKTRVDMVQPALQACAGNYYTLANDTNSLANAFTKIFQGYVATKLTH